MFRGNEQLQKAALSIVLSLVLSVAAAATSYCHKFGQIVTICSHDGLTKIYIAPGGDDNISVGMDDHPCCVATALGFTVEVDGGIVGLYTRLTGILPYSFALYADQIDFLHRLIRAPPEVITA